MRCILSYFLFVIHLRERLKIPKLCKYIPHPQNWVGGSLLLVSYSGFKGILIGLKRIRSSAQVHIRCRSILFGASLIASTFCGNLWEMFSLKHLRL